jgi:hypothetical protein
MKIQKSLWIAIVVIIALSVALASFVVLYYQAVNKPEVEQEVRQISLLYSGELITMANYPGAYFTLSFHANMTLFDCKATISYRSINGTQVVINRELGIVDQSDSTDNLSFELSDYPVRNQTVDTKFTEANPPGTIQIVAYGYDLLNADK